MSLLRRNRRSRVVKIAAQVLFIHIPSVMPCAEVPRSGGDSRMRQRAHDTWR
jgi:hypothetical protein